MTTVFVYEYLSALGPGRGDASDPAHVLYREGRAMRDAAAHDFRRIPGVAVRTLDAFATDDHAADLRHAATGADFALVIAPEFDCLLETHSEAVASGGAKLIGPTVDAIRLTSDKLAMAAHWGRTGVPTPRTWAVRDWPGDRFPAVVKPRDGAGSIATFVVHDGCQAGRLPSACGDEGFTGELIAQDYAAGRPASVAFICGEDGSRTPLRPTFQRVTLDGRVHYLGGELPIAPPLADRAVRLGFRALDGMTGLSGYVGVDLILGPAEDGTADVAIEVNPRLTISYVGLRAAAGFNVAEMLLRSARGEPLPEWRWKPGRVRFGADGTVATDAAAEWYP